MKRTDLFLISFFSIAVSSVIFRIRQDEFHEYKHSLSNENNVTATDLDSSLSPSPFPLGIRLKEGLIASIDISPIDAVTSCSEVEQSRQWLEGLVHQLSPTAVDEALSNPDLIAAIKVIGQHAAFRMHVQDYVDEQILRYAQHESFTSVWADQPALLFWFEDPGLVAEKLRDWENSLLEKIQKGEDIGFDSEIDTFLCQQMRIPTWGTTESLDEYFYRLNGVEK